MRLIDSKSKINAKYIAYAAKLGLKLQKTKVDAKKIDDFFLEIYCNDKGLNHVP